ncbi:TetR/AcrR family transcriptional regulator [Actinoplanes sp. L3-i22]|uniref:TetR/AcrR family transcriptional regulator n=1 Tax=Actinoplanes sp. L3-i22 TaxID=2836373 RepID=UPI001C7511E4|nr:TetR/AcrR family transcriptional regulator [Actinoplanes sp. L3-i22]BCY05305.1 putative transcriptional regulator, TetR family protein [Actinoplanes sp. L3-i22]
MSVTSPRRSARERLLAAADELFYAEGVHTIGIDRVIERAGVAKASLYSSFGSKDGLVRAYLQHRHEERRARLMGHVEKHEGPRDRLLAIFDSLAESAAKPGFRGCAFYNAGAESDPNGVVREASEANRAWTRGLLTDLAREAGIAEPAPLVAQLVLLYDGATVGARQDKGPAAAHTARALAAVLVDAALASR